ncbi:MAG: hypothetical protein LT102_07970 [Burkholderiaceae bacterium]|nr:hypothetical protein [Burkholderiaceae bacterium]
MGLVSRSAWLASGIVVWAAHFLVIYGFTALACARGFVPAIQPVIAGAGVVAVALLASIIARGWMSRAHFEHWLSAAIALLALVAVVYETIPAWTLEACA